MNQLYSHFADCYDVISEDRNFANECTTLLSYISKPVEKLSFLELFAGPAYHGAELKKRGADVMCIDSSKEMKDMAMTYHTISDQEYIVGALPDSLHFLPLNKTFDLITIMRFSLGLIPPKAMEKLLESIHDKLAVDGLLAIELHRLNLLTADLNDLTIRSRTYPTRDGKGTIRCEWPSGPIRWDENALKVEMPVNIIVKQDGHIEEQVTVSHEHIYLLEHFEKYIDLHGGYKILKDSKGTIPMFAQSKMILLRKEL